MASSNIKYPSGGGGSTPFATTIPVLVVNEYSSLTINSVQLLNDFDDPFVIGVPGTGYNSFPISGPSGGVLRRFLKGTVDVTVPPATIRINFSAAIPTSFNVNAFTYGTSVFSSLENFGNSGTYTIDVPVFILPGDILVVHVSIP